MKRLGRWWHEPAVMVTLTYDTKRYTKVEAWSRFNTDTAQFMKILN